jgi:hypothetical protein
MTQKIKSKQNDQQLSSSFIWLFSFFPFQIWSICCHFSVYYFFFFFKNLSFVQNKLLISTKSLNNLQVRNLLFNQITFKTGLHCYTRLFIYVYMLLGPDGHN